MSRGNHNSYSNYPGGGDGYGQPSAGFGGQPESFGQQSDGYVDPYAVPTEAKDPYAIDPYADDPYAGAPYAGDLQRDATMTSGWAQAGDASWAQAGAAGAGPQGGPPQFGAYRPSMPTSNAGLIGFIVGLVSLLLCTGFASVVGIFFSAVGMRETGANANPPMDGRGLTIAGLVLNIVGLLMVLGWVVYFVILAVLVFATATAGA